MKKLKKQIKRFLSPIMCLLHGLTHHGSNVYIGVGAKIVNGSQLYVGNGVEFNPYCMVLCLSKTGGRIEIGDNSRVSMFSWISAAGFLKIGKNVEMGPHVFISDHNHKYENVDIPIISQGITPNYPPRISSVSLEIGDDCWIGTNVAIVAPVKIGKHCVIGANSVVNRDIPDYSVAVGSPAKVVKMYDFEKQMWVKI